MADEEMARIVYERKLERWNMVDIYEAIPMLRAAAVVGISYRKWCEAFIKNLPSDREMAVKIANNFLLSIYLCVHHKEMNHYQKIMSDVEEILSSDEAAIFRKEIEY